MYVLCLQLFNFAVVSVGKEICLFIKLLHIIRASYHVENDGLQM